MVDYANRRFIRRVKSEVAEQEAPAWPMQVKAAVGFVAVVVGMALIFAGYMGG